MHPGMEQRTPPPSASTASPEIIARDALARCGPSMALPELARALARMADHDHERAKKLLAALGQVVAAKIRIAAAERASAR